MLDGADFKCSVVLEWGELWAELWAELANVMLEIVPAVKVHSKQATMCPRWRDRPRQFKFDCSIIVEVFLGQKSALLPFTGLLLGRLC